MARKQVIEIVENPDEGDHTYGFNSKSMVVATPEDISVYEDDPPRKRGPGRPPKNGSTSNTYIDVSEINRGKHKETPEEAYAKNYAPTVKMLFGAIGQADSIYASLEEELQTFKHNKSYGGRSRLIHMGEFMNTQANMINTKIAAIRELNSVRHKINDLVLKKAQLDKNTMDENSDKAIQDAYYALVNASAYGLPQMQMPLSPSTINTGVALNGTPIHSSTINTPSINNIESRTEIITGNGTAQPDTTFDSYQSNLTPDQKRMIVGNDPNIKEVVVYDQSSGNKWFDVVNVQTGQSIPGVSKSAPFLMDNMRVDVQNGIAVNSNVNRSWPLVIVGSKALDEL